MNKIYLALVFICASFINLTAQNSSSTLALDSNATLIEFLSAATYNVKK